MDIKTFNLDDKINVVKVEVKGERAMDGVPRYYKITVRAEFAGIASAEQNITVCGYSNSNVARSYKPLIERMKEQTVKTLKDTVLKESEVASQVWKTVNGKGGN